MKCNHVLDTGHLCGSEAVRHQPYCYQHRHNYTSPDLPGDPSYRVPKLNSHEALRTTITQVLQAFLVKKINLKEATLCLNLLRQAAKTLLPVNAKSKPAEPATTEAIPASPKPATPPEPATTAVFQPTNAPDPYHHLSPLRS